MKAKSLSALLLVVCILAALLTGCAAPEKQTQEEQDTVLFTDDAGRQVELPAQITSVAPTGSVGTMILAAAAPDCLVTVSSTLSQQQLAYLPPQLSSLPVTGQVFGGKSDLNLEALLAAAPQVIIDLGDRKKDMAADLDNLQAQIGIPVIFLEADLSHMAQAFRTLGGLLAGKGERCAQLAAFVDRTVSMAEENSAKIPEDCRLSVLYTTGLSGLDTNAAGSSQAQVLELVGAENAVQVENPANKSGGNPISPEQLYLFDPDVILFAPDSIYDTVGGDAVWQQLRAVRDGRYCEVPGLPYNWLSNPPSMNMLPGVWWLGNLLYPEVYDYDTAAVIREFYQLFWDCQLTEDELGTLFARAGFRE